MMDFSGIKELTIGEVKLKELSVDGVKLWQSGRLPAGYTELEYIEATGAQYIDTGITGRNGLGVEMNIEVLSPVVSGGSCLIGSTNSSSQRCYLTANPVATPFRWEFGAGSYYTNNNVAGVLNHRYDIRIDWTKASSVPVIDGETIAVLTNTVTFDDNSTNMFLFARNKSGTAEKFASAKLYSTKMYTSGTLVREFVPAKYKDGAVGLYDLVTNTFFPNKGTGKFIAGGAV